MTWPARTRWARCSRSVLCGPLADRLVDGTITVAASEHRSQLRNRQAAASRLAALLTAATAPPPAARAPTRPKPGGRERRLAEKQRRSELKRLRRSHDD